MIDSSILEARRKGRFSEMRDWKEQYALKKITAYEAVELIRDKDVIATPGGGSWPQAFDQALATYVKERDYHVDVHSLFMLEKPVILNEEYKDNVSFYSIFFGQERNLVSQGNVNYIPLHLGKTGDQLLNRSPRVVVMSCTPPDENGWMSRSIWGSHMHRDVFEADACEVVVVEVNRNLPYLASDGEKHLMIHVSEVDYITENDYTWKEIPSIQSTDVEKKIAAYIAEMIPNGACIQLGQGGLANAIGSNLVYAGKQDLGLQTEVLTNCVAELMQAGVINNSKKQTYPGRSVAGAVVGDKTLWDFCHNNPDICMKEIDWVNDPINIARNNNVISINNAMEIDLSGQVASEAIVRRQYTGTGGQLQWVIGSQWSSGGKSIIALNSTYFDKKEGRLKSKIKGTLTEGSIITTPRTCVQYIVTEYGVANLKYKSLKERAEALIAIAHPDFRDELSEQAKLWFS